MKARLFFNLHNEGKLFNKTSIDAEHSLFFPPSL
jgi:hypothetical protein